MKKRAVRAAQALQFLGKWEHGAMLWQMRIDWIGAIQHGLDRGDRRANIYHELPMPISPSLPKWTALMASILSLLAGGCAKNAEFSSSFLTATNAPHQMNSNELAKANAIVPSPHLQIHRKVLPSRVFPAVVLLFVKGLEAVAFVP